MYLNAVITIFFQDTPSRFNKMIVYLSMVNCLVICFSLTETIVADWTVKQPLWYSIFHQYFIHPGGCVSSTLSIFFFLAICIERCGATHKITRPAFYLKSQYRFHGIYSLKRPRPPVWRYLALSFLLALFLQLPTFFECSFVSKVINYTVCYTFFTHYD